MLRFYDENDILKPAIVKENGYRYYDSKQLLEASHIQYLRYLGLTTVQMKQEETMVNYQVEVKTIPEKDMMCKRGMIPF